MLVLVLLHTILKISLANVERFLAERSETKSNVKWDGFEGPTCVVKLKSSDRTKQCVCSIYIYIVSHCTFYLIAYQYLCVI